MFCPIENFSSSCAKLLLEKRINNVDTIKLNRIESLQFLNSETENQTFFNPSKKKYFQTSFYKLQRKKMNILMIGNDPKGANGLMMTKTEKNIPNPKFLQLLNTQKKIKNLIRKG